MLNFVTKTFFISFLGVLVISTVGVGDNVNNIGASQRKIKCSIPQIPNGYSHYRKRNTVMRINCIQGYILFGIKTIECIHGRWDGEMPVCAKKGCSKKLQAPSNGQIHTDDDMKATLFCNDNFRIAGGSVTYCNGSAWDRPLGTCREIQSSIQFGCDFETNDVCGWVYDEFSEVSWKRTMAANMFLTLRTGPQYDHTTMISNGGHYMLMESFTQKRNATAQLISPIYPKELSLRTACCFRFYYFMYGATVGSLNVYVRPMSIEISEMIDERKFLYFNKTGNQNNIWNEGFFYIEEMPDDFQIIFIGTSGNSHLSDIAIDDVQLMTGIQCRPFNKEDVKKINKPTSATSPTSLISIDNSSAVNFNENDKRNVTKNDSATSNDEGERQQPRDSAIYDVQSCEFRCMETKPSGLGIVMKNGLFYKSCDCHPECEEINSCCPNYHSICILEEDSMPTENTFLFSLNDEMENVTSITTITKAKTTAAATAKKKLTTMSTIPSIKPTKTATIKKTIMTTVSTTAKTTTKTIPSIIATSTSTQATAASTKATTKFSIIKMKKSTENDTNDFDKSTTLQQILAIATSTIQNNKNSVTTATTIQKQEQQQSNEDAIENIVETKKQNVNSLITVPTTQTTTTTTTTTINQISNNRHQYHSPSSSLSTLEIDTVTNSHSTLKTITTIDTTTKTNISDLFMSTNRINTKISKLQSKSPDQEIRKPISIWKIKTDKHHNSMNRHNSILLTIMTVISGIIMIAIILGAIHRRTIHNCGGGSSSGISTKSTKINGATCSNSTKNSNSSSSSSGNIVTNDDDDPKTIIVNQRHNCNDGSSRTSSLSRNRKSMIINFIRRIFSSNNNSESDVSSYNSDFHDTTSLIYNSTYEDEIVLHIPGAPISTL